MQTGRDRKIQKRHFVTKELRYSIGFIVIWSLLAGVIFIFLAKELRKVIHHEIVPVIIIVGYGVIVVLLTLFFSHRFIGPFERLKMEMRLILAGDYNRRLHIRQKDDLYIRSFIAEINILLDGFEKMHIKREDLLKGVGLELERLVATLQMEQEEEKRADAVRLCREKINVLFKKPT